MVRLWSGDIDSARGALQLLLLVDYICDWGRDKFRESTIRSLAALSRSNRQGTVASDIFSLRAATATPAPTLPLRRGTMDEMPATPVRVPQARTGGKMDYKPGRYLDPDEQKKLINLPSLMSLVRDIRFVMSRSTGILITTENLEVLRKSSSDENFDKFATTLMLTFVIIGFETTWDGLNQVETIWHKGGDGLDPARRRNTNYIATMSCAWSLSASWEPVRELYWLAVEKSALYLLGNATYGNLPPVVSLTPLRSNKSFTAEDFEQVLSPYTEICARLNITACLLRAYGVLKPYSTGNLYVEPPQHIKQSSARRAYVDSPGIDYDGLHAGAVVTQLLSDCENGWLKSCTMRVHRRIHEHVINRVEPKDPWEREYFNRVFLCQQNLLGKAVLDVGTPLLVIDPQEVNPFTEVPAHCIFALEEGPPKRFLGHATGSHEMYFVSERVFDDRRQSWTGPCRPHGMANHMISTSKSGNVWLVQASHHPAAENVLDGGEPVEYTPDEPTVFETPILMDELRSPVDNPRAVTNWVQDVSREFIGTDGNDDIFKSGDDDVGDNDHNNDVQRAESKLSVTSGLRNGGSDDEGGVDSVAGGPRDSPAELANPESKQERARAPSVPMLDGQELGDQNGAGERSSRPGKGARGNIGTLQAERVLPRRSKRISMGRQA